MFSHEQVRLHSLDIFPPARQINKNTGHTIGYLFYLVTCSRLSYVESWLLRNAFLGNLVLDEINVLHIQETAGVRSVVEWNTSRFDVGTFLQLFNKWTDSLVLNELIKNCNFLFFVSDGKQQGVPKLIIPVLAFQSVAMAMPSKGIWKMSVPLFGWCSLFSEISDDKKVTAVHCQSDMTANSGTRVYFHR